MKRNKISMLAGFFCIGITLTGTQILSAADEEASETQESIRQMVEEAQRVASEWAYRIKEWNSGEKRPATYMGIVIEQVPDVLRDYIDLPKGIGLLLAKVIHQGPAYAAGLRDNDILVEFDGQLVVNYSQLSTLIDLRGPGATVPVKVIRKGEEMEFAITLEERLRRGTQFIPATPDVPAPPEAPLPPDIGDIEIPEEVGQIMQKVEEWIPGSVRVYIDDTEQVHVDLSQLKEDLGDLRNKLTHVEILQEGDLPGLVREYGDLGARTTVVHVADKNITYRSKDGKLVLNSTNEGQFAMAWNPQGDLIYEGEVPADYAGKLPPEVVRMIDSLKQSREKLKLETGGHDLEIQLNQDDIDPVTCVYP